MSCWVKYLKEKCLWMKCLFGRNVFGGNVFLGKMSQGEMSEGEISFWEKCHVIPKNTPENLPKQYIPDLRKFVIHGVLLTPKKRGMRGTTVHYFLPFIHFESQ